jgi:hypothetical protein
MVKAPFGVAFFEPGRDGHVSAFLRGASFPGRPEWPVACRPGVNVRPGAGGPVPCENKAFAAENASFGHLSQIPDAHYGRCFPAAENDAHAQRERTACGEPTPRLCTPGREGFVIFRNRAQCMYCASPMVKQALRIVPGSRQFASHLPARRFDGMKEI